MDDNRKNEEFDFSYTAPDGEEKRWIEDIRRQYLPEEEQNSKVTEIKALHKKARFLPKLVAGIMGTVGTLTLGVGMTLTLKWDRMTIGIIVGLFGMAVIFLTYPVHQYLIDRGKKKYGEQIVKLADEMLPRKGDQNANENNE